MFERRIALKSVRIVKPKSARRAAPVLSMRMLAYKDRQRYKESVVNVATHAFEIPVCDPELVKVRYAKRHLGKLWVVKVHKYKTSREVYDGSTYQT